MSARMEGKRHDGVAIHLAGLNLVSIVTGDPVAGNLIEEHTQGIVNETSQEKRTCQYRVYKIFRLESPYQSRIYAPS